MRHASSPRGFTLIELAISIALGVIVIGSATAVLATVLRDNRRARVHSEMQRDAEFASQIFAQEIRQAGLGVPSGHHISENCSGAGSCSYIFGTGTQGTSTDPEFQAQRVLVAGANEIAILGDLPRPDSNYSSFGPLHNRNTGTTRDGVAWHTENNGTCIPPGCTTGGSSMFFPGAANCSNAATEITCPWGSRRLAPAEALQIVDGSGNWSHTRSSSPLSSAANGVFNARGLVLAFPFDQGANIRWANNSASAGPAGFIGQGWVTTLDRVFYRVQGTNLVRTQCWGDPDPLNPNWPIHTSNTIPGTVTVNPAVSGATQRTASTCVGPEVIARNVTSLTFTYSDAAGTPIVAFPDGAAKNRIRRVDWQIVLSRTDQAVGGRPVTYTIQGATRIEN